MTSPWNASPPAPATLSLCLKAQMPHYHKAKGFAGFTAMADRQSGKVMGISFWESEADREASESLGAQARSSSGHATGRGTQQPRRRRRRLGDLLSTRARPLLHCRHRLPISTVTAASPTKDLPWK